MNRKTFCVYYRREPSFRYDPALTMDTVLDGETFAAVHVVLAHGLEQVFLCMQAENWSPNGEEVSRLRSLGVIHTSMSVGDVAVDLETKEGWQCDVFGWMPIPSNGLAEPIMEEGSK